MGNVHPFSIAMFDFRKVTGEFSPDSTATLAVKPWGRVPPNHPKKSTQLPSGELA